LIKNFVISQKLKHNLNNNAIKINNLATQ